MPLLHQPGKEVVGNGGEVEAGLFGALGVTDKIVRSVLLRHKLVAKLDHDVLLAGAHFPAGAGVTANVRGRRKFAAASKLTDVGRSR